MRSGQKHACTVNCRLTPLRRQAVIIECADKSSCWSFTGQFISFKAEIAGHWS